MEYVHHYTSPLGGITLASNGEVLTGLWFVGQRHFPESISTQCVERFLPVFEETCHWLDIYFKGDQPGYTPPFRICSTPFREAVLRELLTIPYGKTITYGEIARHLALSSGQPVSAQAVGGAVGHNDISIIIPCHRVVGADGSLIGYAAGLDKKIRLLQLEGVILGADCRLLK